MEKHYKLVLFDFDKTLYAGRHFALRLIFANIPHIMRVRAERKVRSSLGGLDLGNGQALRDKFTSLLASASGISPKEAEAWYVGTYLKSMPRILGSYSPRPKAAETIAALLDSGIRVCVLSDYPNTRERLNAIGITDERILCLSSEELGALKPAPRPFIEAAGLAGAKPEETLVVGDRADNDGAGSRDAGMDCLLIKGKRATGLDGFEAKPWDEVAETLRQMSTRRTK